MPVEHLLENDARLLAFRFHGSVRQEKVEAAILSLARSTDLHTEYGSFLLFHGSTDLSEIGPEELKTIKSRMNAAYDKASVQRTLGHRGRWLTRRQDNHATLKAMCDADQDTDMRYRFFIEVAPALA